MRKTILVFGLLAMFALVLNGCSSKPVIVMDEHMSSETAAPSFSDSKEALGETVKTEPTDISQNHASSVPTEQETETAPAESFPEIADTPKTEKATIPAQPEVKTTEETNSPKESKPMETKPVVPPPTIPTMQEEEPKQPTAPKEPEPNAEPVFDISYWTGYAISYAESIGLSLDSTATDCWDNPISANPKRTNIEADIISRLNRYKNVEGFAAVWIWSEKVSETDYNIFIGYA